MSEMERRCVEVGELRALKAAAGDGPEVRRIGGYAALFNTVSEELWGFREEIAPGAFAQTLQEGTDVRALFNHDPNLVLGRSTAGTLRLQEDDRGLAFEIDLPDTSYAQDLWRLIERRDVSQMSFGFLVVTDEWRMKDGLPLRTVRTADLFDVSPVTYPAYAETNVAVRSRAQEICAEKDRAAPVSVLLRRVELAELDV